MKGATSRGTTESRVAGVSIHAPNEGSDFAVIGLMFSLKFQSTLPMKGATRTSRLGVCSALFQSTLPMKGATRWLSRGARPRTVSIHAPNEGSDTFCWIRLLALSVFQSTLPMKGATILDAVDARIFQVSIHAPNEGSDISASSSGTHRREFQSTLPMKGATHGHILPVIHPACFNPRSQ